MKVELTISGMQETIAMLERQEKGRVDDVYNMIHNEMMTAIMSKGMKEAPVRTGYLSASAYVDHMRTQRGFSVTGGFRANYASFVDENHRSKAGFFSENIAQMMRTIDQSLKEMER